MKAEIQSSLSFSRRPRSVSAWMADLENKAYIEIKF